MQIKEGFRRPSKLAAITTNLPWGCTVMFTTGETAYLILIAVGMVSFMLVVLYLSYISRGPFVGQRDLAPPKRKTADEQPRHAA
jgi:hypothetical protein